LTLQHPTRFILFGILFSIFWSSASVAGKFGLMSAEPLTLFTSRFISAGILLLTFSTFQKDRKFPSSQEWVQLVVFGALNTTVYLGIFIIALKEVAAGITTLMLALNPLMISMITSLWLKRKIAPREWGSIVLGIAGVCVATFPLIQHGYASLFGIVLLVGSMLAYSIAAVYYSSVSWNLSRMTINGWQVLIGGMLLLPFTLIFEGGHTQYDLNFWMSLGWLVIPVSILAVQLWLHLLKEDTVKASLWLFLCPIFGLAYASLILREPFSRYTVIGAVMVISSLLWGQSKNFRKTSSIPND
jgi:drug/metabolite transporter (DMT)-like permease